MQHEVYIKQLVYDQKENMQMWNGGFFFQMFVFFFKKKNNNTAKMEHMKEIEGLKWLRKMAW